MMSSKGVVEHIRKSYFWLRGSSGFANGLHKNQIHWGVLQLHGSDADNSELGKVDKWHLPFHTVPLVSNLVSSIRWSPVRWPGYLQISCTEVTKWPRSSRALISGTDLPASTCPLCVSLLCEKLKTLPPIFTLVLFAWHTLYKVQLVRGLM